MGGSEGDHHVLRHAAGLRHTALELPVFGFGSAHLGELYGRVDEAHSRATLDAAWDAGVRYYDTAPWYGRGLSEHRLGGFLRTSRATSFQITTKVGRTLHRPKDPVELRPRALDRRAEFRGEFRLFL